MLDSAITFWQKKLGADLGSTRNPKAVADAGRWIAQAVELGDEPADISRYLNGGVFVRLKHGDGHVVSDTRFGADSAEARFYRLDERGGAGELRAHFLGAGPPNLRDLDEARAVAAQ